MDIHAHRGFSSKYLENTRLAFEACKDLNITAIELDVQFSKDKKLVVFHDENIKRLTGVDKFLKDLTFEQLKTYSFKDSQTFISLDEYLDIVKDFNLVSNVELKTGKFEYEGIEREVYETFKRRNMLDKLLISSFNHKSLEKFKEIDPSIDLAALYSNPKKLDEKYLDKIGIKIYHPNYKYLSLSQVRRLHKKGIKINAWTVNDKFNYFKLKLFGINGIITNYPQI